MTRTERFTALYRDHAPALRRFLVRLTGGATDQAEELLQETMVRAWRRLDAVPEDPTSARRWLYTVARRIMVDTVRARRRRPAEVDLADLDPVLVAGDAIEEAMAAHRLRQAFDRLSDQHRTVLRELHLKGGHTSDVAQLLRVPVGTVRSRAHYALRALREDLERVD